MYKQERISFFHFLFLRLLKCMKPSPGTTFTSLFTGSSLRASAVVTTEDWEDRQTYVDVPDIIGLRRTVLNRLLRREDPKRQYTPQF